MKIISVVRATAHFIQRILDAHIPMAESVGVRIR